MFITAGYELLTFDIDSKYRTMRIFKDIVLVYNKNTHKWKDILIDTQRFYTLMLKYDVKKFSQEYYVYD